MFDEELKISQLAHDTIIYVKHVPKDYFKMFKCIRFES